VRSELGEYFNRARRTFSVELETPGTPFQQSVWMALREIPYGSTISYGELADRLGNPDAVRAVARANGDNRIAILIPCHRVVGKDGRLTGYGGGLWRKRRLIDLETGVLPLDTVLIETEEYDHEPDGVVDPVR
ncbi:MAG TPA: methylated-DNA--[protein]-cysteine S-methyltransferase, partial [Rhodothermales bacterium]